MGRLMQIFAAPELASTEEQTKFIGCFEDETLLRLFLTGVMGGAGPLSVETSGCIRTGMEGVDLSTVMLSGAAGDEQAAMAGSMSAFILSVMCPERGRMGGRRCHPRPPPRRKGKPAVRSGGAGRPRGLRGSAERRRRRLIPRPVRGGNGVRSADGGCPGRLDRGGSWRRLRVAL